MSINILPLARVDVGNASRGSAELGSTHATNTSRPDGRIRLSPRPRPYSGAGASTSEPFILVVSRSAVVIEAGLNKIPRRSTRIVIVGVGDYHQIHVLRPVVRTSGGSPSNTVGVTR